MPRTATIKDLKRQIEHVAELPLAAALRDEVAGWSQQGWPGVTTTTRSLLGHWFKRDEEVGDRFHSCQQRAIETVIYCHEILRQPDPTTLYTKLAPEILRDHSNIREDAGSLAFERYCLKMATGSGKTWVLIALVVWQYFNALRQEELGRFSYRFLVRQSQGRAEHHPRRSWKLGSDRYHGGWRIASRTTQPVMRRGRERNLRARRHRLLLASRTFGSRLSPPWPIRQEKEL